jgi:tyrosinase
MNDNNANPVENPTWYGEIRNMFTKEDITHMGSQGLDLTNYNVVKNSAYQIYGQVDAGNMPPGKPWSDAWVETFSNWMNTGFPKGTIAISQNEMLGFEANASETIATRIRKEISMLSIDELNLLKKAFRTIMQKEPLDPNSYFALAGWHGLPNPRCMHHIPGYNPWHRAYLLSFENALRMVPDCENVTLPYWDFATSLPDIFNHEPFDNYTLPITVNDKKFPKGYTTTRYSAKEIIENLESYDVLGDFKRAFTKTDWEDYHGFIDNRTNNTTIAGHDGGHVSIGETMGNQDVSAFDPIFWFYHCNLDRMFWEWQKEMQATDLNKLLSTIQSDKSRKIFTNPNSEKLPPFDSIAPTLNTLSIIDSVNSLDVDYQIQEKTIVMNMKVKTIGSTLASDEFFVHTTMVNVRVKGINRLKIPGSFNVHLMKDGEVIASKAFFQPDEVEKCENCVENALAHFDFELPIETVSEGKLGIWVEPLDHEKFGDRFPHKMMGNPTVNVRLLLSNE